MIAFTLALFGGKPTPISGKTNKPNPWHSSAGGGHVWRVWWVPVVDGYRPGRCTPATGIHPMCHACSPPGGVHDTLGGRQGLTSTTQGCTSLHCCCESVHVRSVLAGVRQNSRSAGWPAGWLAGHAASRPAGRLVGRPAGRPAGQLVGWSAVWSAGRLVGRPGGRLLGRVAGRPADRSAGQLVGRPGGRLVGGVSSWPLARLAGRRVGSVAGRSASRRADASVGRMAGRSADWRAAKLAKRRASFRDGRNFSLRPVPFRTERKVFCHPHHALILTRMKRSMHNPTPHARAIAHTIQHTTNRMRNASYASHTTRSTHPHNDALRAQYTGSSATAHTTPRRLHTPSSALPRHACGARPSGQARARCP